MMEPRLKFKKKLGRSTDGGGLGPKIFKIPVILLWHGSTALDGVQLLTRILRAKSIRPRTCLDKSSGRYTQTNSAGGFEQVQCGCQLGVLDRVHIGATLRIRLNRRFRRIGLMLHYFEHLLVFQRKAVAVG